MRPLQDHLDAAGFDGLQWQAGRGNPVAASNFMLAKPVEGGGREHRWVWIDLESGVPALFAMNPLATLGFYLPRSFRHRHWLFDDVDVPRLRRYLQEHRSGLEDRLGREALREIDEQVTDLDRCQRQWRSIPRHRRAISYELSQERITTEQAAFFHTRPLRWTLHLALTGALRAAASVAAKAQAVLARLRRTLRLRRLGTRCWRFCTSERYGGSRGAWCRPASGPGRSAASSTAGRSSTCNASCGVTRRAPISPTSPSTS